MVMAIHPLQSRAWGDFREKMGIKVVQEGGLQVTIHPIPYTPWTIGYLPKGPLPDSQQVATLATIAREHRCVYIKCEPMVEQAVLNKQQLTFLKKHFVPGRSLFTTYNFVLDVTKSEADLLAGMKQKTRYNIRVAEKKGVTVALDDSSGALLRYLDLTEETTKRQKFYSHSRAYHRIMFEALHTAGMAHLLVARYHGEIITTWVLFKHKDTLYYPYGASSREHRGVMANNLVMWEAIKLAKSWKLKYLDMWGALGPDPDPRDPWYGFHTFKSGYGARHVEYIGTWDYVAQPLLYYPLRAVEWLRFKLLRLFT